MNTDTEGSLRNTGDEIGTIVAALDTSNSALRVLGAAARQSRGGAALHLVHVFRSSRFEHARAGAPHTSSEIVEDAKEHLGAHVKSARGQTRSQVMGHFAVGDPASEILRICAEVKADLLVVGTHDYAGLERLILGSIAETLVRKAPCSVLVIRPQRSHD